MNWDGCRAVASPCSGLSDGQWLLSAALPRKGGWAIVCSCVTDEGGRCEDCPVYGDCDAGRRYSSKEELLLAAASRGLDVWEARLASGGMYTGWRKL